MRYTIAYRAARVVTLSSGPANDDDSVLVSGGVIVGIGSWRQLSQQHNIDEVHDLGNRWLLPGLRNAHGHFGEWPPDEPLELFLIGRYPPSSAEAVRALARRTAVALARAGVTWTHHLHYGPHPGAAIDGYRDIGLRVQFCLGLLDRYSVLPYDDDNAHLLSRLNNVERRQLKGRALGKTPVSWPRWLETFADLARAYADDDGVEVIAGPDNPQWCTDELLLAARELGVPLHVHVQETAAQRAWAIAKFGESPIARLARLNILGPDVTLAHLTHLDDHDLSIVGQTGATVAVNAASNLRLGSGMPSYSRLVTAGIPTLIGVDGGGFADDMDMLSEARLNALLARADPTPGWTITPAAALRSAAGVLRVGGPADMIAIDAPTDLSAAAEAAIIARSSRHDVTDVWVGGTRVVTGGRVVAATPHDTTYSYAPARDRDIVDLLRPHVLAALTAGPPRQ